MFDNIKNAKKNKGQVVILTAMFSLVISVLIISVISSPVVSQMKMNKNLFKAKESFYISESGNEDIVYRIKNGQSILGQEDLVFSNGIAQTTVTDLGNGIKEILTVGDVNNRIRKIKTKIQTTSGVSFNYGLFTGQGGIEMENNTRINGSIYSNGSIEGARNVMIAGDVYVAPRPATTTNIKWETNNEDFIFGKYVGSEQRVDTMQSFVTTTSGLRIFKVSLHLKKVGSPANLSVKIVKDKNGVPDKNNVIAEGSLLSSLIGTNYSFMDVGFNSNPEITANQIYWIISDTTRDDTNYFVWGMDNASGYTGGTAKYSTDWTKGSFINIAGDLDFQVWTGDENSLGVLDTVIVGDGVGGVFPAHAHTIKNSQISGDAFAYSFVGGSVGGNIIADNIADCSVVGDADYNTKTNCTVGGQSHSPTTPLSDPSYLVTPVSEANIQAWKDEAVDFGYITAGDLIPINGAIIGPGVIGGDLIIESDKIVKLGGTLYVEGNIIVNGNAGINLGISYGTTGSGAIISDGWVNLYNNVKINNPRTGSGHLMLLSTARCDKYYGFVNCNSEQSAINLENNVQSDILVAPYGIIELSNNISVVALVGDQLNLKNNIVLNYEQGLTNMNFSSGPSGSWGIESWREVE